MDKRQVAAILEEIGTLLELRGENVFKTRAYQNGARAVLSLEEDLGLLVREKRLHDVRGIGDALARKISDLVLAGRLDYYEDLKAQFPPGFLDLLRIPGFGPKKARALHESLGISSLDDLEAAARADRLRDLPGFGARSQEKILEGIAHVRRNVGRFLISVAEEEAAALVGALRPMKEVRRISVAGSLRRRGETVKDIDIVVATDHPEPVMACFTALPSVEAVIGHGPTKSSVRLHSGIAADLRCVSDAEFPYALLYFTGSKAHNVALRGRAVKMGYRLNEYGLFRGTDSDDPAKNVPCRDEAGIYRTLGLAYVEPELREDTGEIAAAEAGTLPDLITGEDVKGLLHLHTTWSDGSDTIEEMAAAAVEMGLQYIGITDHSQSAMYARGLLPERLAEQQAAIEKAARRFKGKLTIFKGIESDILPDGSLDYPEEILATFDFVVASVHGNFNLDEAAQTKRIVKALGNPHTRILGHPTGRLLLQRGPYPVNLAAVYEAAAAHNVALEINAHPHRLDLDWRECRAARERGCLITINPDAHETKGLADTRFGVGVARRGWLRASDVINTFDTAAIRAFLRREPGGASPKAPKPKKAPNSKKAGKVSRRA